MKKLIFLFLPFSLFAQDISDSVKSASKESIMKSYYQMNRMIYQKDPLGGFKEEMKSLGITIRNNQQIEEYSYKWQEGKSLGYNVVGEIFNKIINAKKLNP